MIRECTNEDMQMISEYLSGEVYGRAILAAVNAYGFAERFQTVYVDVEAGQCEGVYLWLHGTLLLYCKENQVGIDFLEEMMGIEAPQKVAGRKDNVNIVSWLLSDYVMEKGKTLPELTDKEGNPVEGLEKAEHEGEWAVLTR